MPIPNSSASMNIQEIDMLSKSQCHIKQNMVALLEMQLILSLILYHIDIFHCLLVTGCFSSITICRYRCLLKNGVLVNCSTKHDIGVFKGDLLEFYLSVGLNLCLTVRWLACQTYQLKKENRMDKYCCKKKCMKVPKDQQEVDCYQFRQGGSSTIPADEIRSYCNRLHIECGDKYGHMEVYDWQELEPYLITASINLKNKILNYPTIRMNFNEQVLSKMRVHKDPETGRQFRLLGNNPFQAIQIINTAATSAPHFNHHHTTGVPMHALFLDYIQSTWGQAFFANKSINDSLKELFDAYSQDILKTEKSLQFMEGWVSGPALRHWNPHEFQIPDIKNPLTMGFKSWEEYFLRKFKPDARPIQKPVEGSGFSEDDVIINSCESYPLVAPAMPVSDIKLKDEFWLKDNKYSLFDMFNANEKKDHHALGYAKLFEGGTIYQAYLNPWTYHRWQAPVDGVIVDIYPIEGCYFLQNPGLTHQDDSQDQYVNSQPFLSCVSTRMVYIIKANNEKIGYIGIIYIGMSEVSSCVNTKKIGDQIKKGQDIGHFQFGGSSHVVLFQKDCILDFSRNVQKAYYIDPKTHTMKSHRMNINIELATVRNILTPAQQKDYKSQK